MSVESPYHSDRLYFPKMIATIYLIPPALLKNVTLALFHQEVGVLRSSSLALGGLRLQQKCSYVILKVRS